MIRLPQLMAEPPLRRAALVLLALVPLCLLHAVSVADVLIDVIAGLFLLRSAARREFAWARQSWVRLALVWWVWLVVCSTPWPWPGFGAAGWRDGFVQALVTGRLLLFTAALQAWLLTTPSARRLVLWGLALSCLWIGVECWQQYLTGHDIFGYPRWGDGSLTGPFRKPLAGALFAHLLFIAVLPSAAWLARHGTWRGRALGGGLVAAGLVTCVLIGQRLGVAYGVLGLVVVAFYRPRLRLAALAAVVAAGAVLAALPVLSPPTEAKLIGETRTNLSHFSQSPYGEIFTVAAVMGLDSPWHGLGYRGYRASCLAPRFNTGLPWLGIGPTSRWLGACNRHPQNYYLQALTDSGFPGLLLFSALMGYWCWAAARFLRRQPDPLRVGLFAAVLTFAWPIASTDEFPTLYMLGWFFLILGFALSCTDIAARNPQADMLHD